MSYQKRNSILVVLGILVFSGALIVSFSAPAVALNEGCASCHQGKVSSIATSLHATLACETCHDGAAGHASNTAIKPAVHFDLQLCGSCHPDQYTTYIKDVPMKTLFGGSVNPPTDWAKTKDFPYYNTIIDGYGFVKEYNEERAHAYMLKDHQEVTRFKYDTCMQCKSTKVAYYWDSGKARTLENDVHVEAGHFDAGETITVPEGTTISLSTDRITPYSATGRPNHEVKVLAALPDGTLYASYAYPGAITGVDPDPAIAKKARKWTWAAVYALFRDGLSVGSPTVDAGVACNHCHDPHTVKPRIIRKSLIDAISRNGINPYARRKVYAFDSASRQDKLNTLCAQCHVEYVCGNSALDVYDRDYFPWAKVSALESIYSTMFDYNVDWKHGIGMRPWQSVDPALAGYYPPGALYPITEKLIKSQHPETETYWSSMHYQERASCADCHMPRTVNAEGEAFTSHWFTSPVKLLKLGVNPCLSCHREESISRKLEQIESRQKGIFSLQAEVQQALVESLKAIQAAKALGRNVDSAVSYHQMAHIRWENLVVSENSMGFHNWDEVERELEAARSYARTARSLAH
jgi:nitrite reductase (cytochrome c-552)